MRKYLAFLLVLVVLLTAGCVEEPAPVNETAAVTTTATTAPQAGSGPDTTRTPAGTPTPEPEQMAFISGISCATGDKLNPVYHCGGDVRIRSDRSAEAVQVIAVYADNNTFRSNTVSLGSSEAISKHFVYFPDSKYQGQTPSYFVRLDNQVYPVAWSGSIGAALSNTPGAEGIEIQ